MTRALLLGIYIGAPEFLETPPNMDIVSNASNRPRNDVGNCCLHQGPSGGLSGKFLV